MSSQFFQRHFIKTKFQIKQATNENDNQGKTTACTGQINKYLKILLNKGM
jgi:hypothetical protein